MELQKLYSKVRQAVDAYQMIEDGDKIAIGISGGKDSLTLLYALAGMRKFYPNKYDVVAITVDTGVGNMDFSKVKELCESLNVPYEIIPTQIFPILMERSCQVFPSLNWIFLRFLVQALSPSVLNAPV